VYFLREFTAGQGYAGETNQIIFNLKKKLGDGGYHWKARAISQCIEEMTAPLSKTWLEKGTLVPIPPSKAKEDPLHDDRMLQVCMGIAQRSGVKADVREIVLQRTSTPAFHTIQGTRPKVEELLANYELDERVCDPAPTEIAIIDDVLTNGTHFKAMQRILSHRFPRARIVGMFYARRALPVVDAADWLDLDDEP
jgi:predicted amidophosphoribosyltransferase